MAVRGIHAWPPWAIAAGNFVPRRKTKKSSLAVTHSPCYPESMENSDDTMGSTELPTIPEIVSGSEAITVTKGDGTEVSYYIFPEFEVHANTIFTGAVQNWHFHKNIEEIIFVTSGQIDVLWLDGGKQKTSKTLNAGDLCRLGSSVHNIANNTKETATFLVYRYIPTGKNQHMLIKGDRYPVEVE